MKTEKINNFEVKTIPKKAVDKKDILGSDLFDEIYCNVFLCAKKKSGKTNVIYNIVKKCCNKETTVYVFCPTHEKDVNWVAIKEMLDNKDIPNEFYTSIKENNNLKELIEKLQKEENVEESSEEEEEEKICSFEEDKYKVKIKKKKPKKISNKYLIIFDDISTELQDKNVSQLLKTNRHYKSKVLISSQWVHDIAPMSRRQIDTYILFGGLNNDKLEKVFENADLNIEFDVFLELYKDATKDKYNFFYVDSSNCTYRKNFNIKYIV